MPKRNGDRRTTLSPVPVDRRGAERRVHERVVVDFEIDYRANETFLFAYITDISAMGIFVQTNTPEPIGTHLNLCFRMPLEMGGRHLEIAGEVMWVNELRPDDADGRNPGMGIRFVDLGDEDRGDVMRLVHTFAFLDEETEDEPSVERPFAKS